MDFYSICLAGKAGLFSTSFLISGEWLEIKFDKWFENRKKGKITKVDCESIPNSAKTVDERVDEVEVEEIPKEKNSFRTRKVVKFV